MGLREDLVKRMGFAPAARRLVKTSAGYVQRETSDQEMRDPEPKPPFASDHEIFPQNSQEFSDLMDLHFAVR